LTSKKYSLLEILNNPDQILGESFTNVAKFKLEGDKVPLAAD
jgi:hypothetical protein